MHVVVNNFEQSLAVKSQIIFCSLSASTTALCPVLHWVH